MNSRPFFTGHWILISSSADLAKARKELSDRILEQAHSRRWDVVPFLWEEETRGGLELGQGTPVQRQIDTMLDGRVTMTLVMFGERVGEALQGEPPDETRKILEEWKGRGLVHPWPNDQTERQIYLDKGCFPLTGTVYELLVGLRMERDASNQVIKVAYVADRNVTPATGLGDIRFNQDRLFNRSDKPTAGSDAYRAWESGYLQQKQGIINVIKAVGSSDHGCYPLRFDTEDLMVNTMAQLAASEIAKRDLERQAAHVFKLDFSHYAIDDIPLPDRTKLREELKHRLYVEGLAGRVLALTGPSGCGKSSLLQKGVLGELPNRFAAPIVLALRPADLSVRQEATPYLRLLGALADAFDANGIAALGGLRKPVGATTTARIEAAVACIGSRLEAAGRTLVLGMDQFEEVLDLASMDTAAQRDAAGSWWQVLRLLGQMVRHERVWIGATLETQRQQRLREMALADIAGLEIETTDADFPLGAVKDFVRDVAAKKGLPLAKNTVAAVEQMVSDFETKKATGKLGREMASFLPLLSIWLHRLFVTFEDRSTSATGLSGMFGKSSGEIGVADLAARGIAFDLGALVHDLVHDAWEEAEQIERRGDEETSLRVVDEAAFRRYLNWVQSHFPGGREAINSCIRDSNFDLNRFVAILEANGISDVPGIAKPSMDSGKPDPVSLDNFLISLVALDHDGNMLLTEAPNTSHTSSISALIASHRRRRLLEPVGPDRVRLIHQAVIDNWPPGRDWFKKQTANLERLRAIRQESRKYREGADFAALALEKPTLVAEAATLLALRRATWGPFHVGILREDDSQVRDFCRSLVAAAPDGSMLSGGDDPVPLIVEAARYDLHETLDRWLTAKPSLIQWRSEQSGETLLHKAAWGAQNAVRVLLKHSAEVTASNAGHWHPIAGAIQTGRLGIVQQLMPRYDTPHAVIGPNGITILHEAARAEDSRILELLLAGDCHVDVFDANRQTPLHYAADAGRSAQVVRLMGCSDRLKRDSDGNSALNIAAAKGRSGVIRAMLNNTHLTDVERDRLLNGDAYESESWATPLVHATANARPDALAVLLSVCDPRAPRHQNSSLHPLSLVAMNNGRRKPSAPLADRVSACVRILLDDGRLTEKDAMQALSCCGLLLDAATLIKNWIVRRGDLSALDDGTLLGWLTGPQVVIAERVLVKRRDLLDRVDAAGQPGWSLLLQKGQPSVVGVALRENISPTDQPGLFRLEAALRVLSAARDGGGSPRHANPLVDVSGLHPVAARLVADWEDPIGQVLKGLGPSTPIRPLPHRLAARGEVDAFDAVVSGLAEPLPFDPYDRPPSELAPRSQREAFQAIESEHRKRTFRQ